MRLMLREPWTVSFVREWWPYMSLRSIVRLRDYELRSARGQQTIGKTLDLHMKAPVRGLVSLREVGSDILTFNEIIREQVYRNVAARVRRCDTLIDLGANIGLASLYFGDRYPTCRLFAVEPNPDSYRMLVRNLKGPIDRGRCRTLRAAVWRSEKTLVADLVNDAHHYSTFAACEAPAAQSHLDTMIGMPIRRIIAESRFENIDLLKVDIEGAEVELFNGDLDWLKNVGAIAIEFHRDSRRKCEFDRLMNEYRFRIYDDGGHTVLAAR
jgi:FkbM family methyltransferase